MQRIRRVIAEAWNNLPESSTQMSHKVRAAKEFNKLPKKGPSSVRKGPLSVRKIERIRIPVRGKRAVRAKRAVNIGGVAKSLLGVARSGYIRKFLFSTAGQF